jgi:hypothetical protein
MIKNIFLLLFILTNLPVAKAYALATLEVIEKTGASLHIDGEVSEEETLPDPLICSRAKKRLELSQKTTREIEYILAKVNNDTTRLNKKEYENLAALEKRRELDFAFLAQPAPTLLVKWNLQSVTEDLYQHILREQVTFSVQTYSFDWEGSGSFFVPENRLFIFPKWSEKTLALKIESQLSDYCFSDLSVGMKIQPL